MQNSELKERCQIIVRPSGIEPETYGLEGRCSIQLSYGRIFTNPKIKIMNFELQHFTPIQIQNPNYWALISV